MINIDYMISFSVLEGYTLYQALIVVFETDDRKFPIYVFGYGAPGVIAVITLVVVLITHDEYHQKNFCWLSNKYNHYFFLTPVFIVLFFNFTILIRCIIVTYRVNWYLKKTFMGIFDFLAIFDIFCLLLKIQI